jgi:hypothetical protein
MDIAASRVDCLILQRYYGAIDPKIGDRRVLAQ